MYRLPERKGKVLSTVMTPHVDLYSHIYRAMKSIHHAGIASNGKRHVVWGSAASSTAKGTNVRVDLNNGMRHQPQLLLTPTCLSFQVGLAFPAAHQFDGFV